MPVKLRLKAAYTTGEAAEILGVSQQTVIRCIDSGELKGYRVPLSRFRRVPHDELVRFAGAHGIEAAIERLRDAEELHASEMTEPRVIDTPSNEGEPYTVGEVADLLAVAPRTVCKWVDSGEIEGYRVPGSADRRVSAGAFGAFLDSHPGFKGQVERRRAEALAAAAAIAAGPDAETEPEAVASQG
jgi:excisionase family DNA binding protein